MGPPLAPSCCTCSCNTTDFVRACSRTAGIAVRRFESTVLEVYFFMVVSAVRPHAGLLPERASCFHRPCRP